MIIKELPSLKIQKLTQEQYASLINNNATDENSIYLTPTEIKDYAFKSDLVTKADLIDGKVPLEQLPDDICGGLTEVSWEDIKDKPFGTTIGYTSIFENQSITTMDLSEEMGAPVYGNEVIFENSSNKSDWIGECTVVYDETIYNLQNKYDSTTEVTYFGNGSLLNFMGVSLEDTGEPFVIVMISSGDDIFGGYMLITTDTQETAHTLSISKLNEVVKTLDPKYIADMYYDTRKIYSFDASVTPDPPSYPIPGFGVNGYKIFDLTPTLDEFFNYKIIRDKNDAGGGSELTFKNQQIILSGDDMWLIQSDQGYFFGLCRKPGLFEAEFQGMPVVCEVPESGIYYMQDSLASWITFDLNLGGELKQIDPKFIPADLNFDLDDYYTKSEVYTRSETTNIINNNLQNYYTKYQVDNAINSVRGDLSGYYTKNEVYSKNEIDNTLNSNYYTKSEVDTALNNIDLSNYYTKTEINNTLSNNYYTKTKIDEIIGDVDSILDEINGLIGE